MTEFKFRHGHFPPVTCLQAPSRPEANSGGTGPGAQGPRISNGADMLSRVDGLYLFPKIRTGFTFSKEEFLEHVPSWGLVCVVIFGGGSGHFEYGIENMNYFLEKSHQYVD